MFSKIIFLIALFAWFAGSAHAAYFPSITVSSSALPTGASTSALQTTGNNSLAAIESALSGGDLATATLQTTANTSLSNIFAELGTISSNTSTAATAANQGTTNSWLTSIDSKLSSQATAANQSTANSSLSTIATNSAKVPINTSGSGSAASATVSTVITLSAPANAVGFVLQNLDTSSANVRWSIGRTATTALGQQLQPGRDTGYIPCGANVSLVAESGTQNYDIQWVTQ